MENPPNNPAARLLAFIVAAKDNKFRNVPARKALAVILSIDENDAPSLFRQVADLLGLTSEIEAAVRRQDAIAPNLLLSWIPGFVKPWMDNPLNQTLPVFLAPVDANVESVLGITSDLLSKARPEPVVNQGEVDKLLSDVRALAKEISLSSLDNRFKIYLIGYLDILESSLMGYKLRGFWSLESGLERCVGRMVVSKKEFEEAAKTKEGASLAQVIFVYAAIVTSALASIQLPQEVQKLLPHHSGTTNSVPTK